MDDLEEAVQQKDRELYDLTLNMQELKQQMEELYDTREELEKHLEVKEAELLEVIVDESNGLITNI